MKKKNLTGLTLNKRKVSELNESVQNMLKGGGYPTQCGTCATAFCGGNTLCAYSCSCSFQGGC